MIALLGEESQVLLMMTLPPRSGDGVAFQTLEAGTYNGIAPLTVPLAEAEEWLELALKQVRRAKAAKR